jgi:hypothetical protein
MAEVYISTIHTIICCVKANEEEEEEEEEEWQWEWQKQKRRYTEILRARERYDVAGDAGQGEEGGRVGIGRLREVRPERLIDFTRVRVPQRLVVEEVRNTVEDIERGVDVWVWVWCVLEAGGGVECAWNKQHMTLQANCLRVHSAEEGDEPADELVEPDRVVYREDVVEPRPA